MEVHDHICESTYGIGQHALPFRQHLQGKTAYLSKRMPNQILGVFQQCGSLVKQSGRFIGPPAVQNGHSPKTFNTLGNVTEKLFNSVLG